MPDQLDALSPRAMAGFGWTFRWELLPTTFDSIKEQPSDLYGDTILSDSCYAYTIREVYGQDLSPAPDDVYWVTPLEESAFQYADDYLLGKLQVTSPTH
jgi:hypothetical protein